MRDISAVSHKGVVLPFAPSISSYWGMAMAAFNVMNYNIPFESLIG